LKAHNYLKLVQTIRCYTCYIVCLVHVCIMSES